MAVQRVLRDVQAQPEVTFYVGTTATDADGAVTVDITRADGTVFATDAATTLVSVGSGTYRYTLAPQSALEYFTLRWEGTFGGVVQHITTHVEIVGGFIVGLADIRALEGLTNTTTFPNARLDEVRQQFEDKAEEFCGVAFVPRFEREVLDGTSSSAIHLLHPRPRTVLSAKLDGVAQTGTATWDLYEDGFVIRDSGTFPWGRRNVEITYEHGLDEPDTDLREAALTAIRAKLLGDRGGIPQGVTQLATDAGVMTFGRPSRPTGIREVDDVLLARRIALVA